MPEASSAPPGDILIIDDDRELCVSLQRLLRMEGFEAVFAHDAQHGLRRAVEERHSLVILDVMLPGGDGRHLLKQLRNCSDVPVIMLTARGDEKDRISGLEGGADDYLPKPFHVRELLARMRAVLKRRTHEPSAPLRLTVGDLVMEPASRRVLLRGSEVALTGTEYEILLLLVKRPGRVVPREEIAEACMGRPMGVFDRSVDNHISNLRKKLGAATDSGERIQNLRGTGYAYVGGTAE